MAEEDEKEKLIKAEERDTNKLQWESIRFALVAHLNELVQAGNKTAAGGDADAGKGGV